MPNSPHDTASAVPPTKSAHSRRQVRRILNSHGRCRVSRNSPNRHQMCPREMAGQSSGDFRVEGSARQTCVVMISSTLPKVKLYFKDELQRHTVFGRLCFRSYPGFTNGIDVDILTALILFITSPIFCHYDLKLLHFNFAHKPRKRGSSS